MKTEQNKMNDDKKIITPETKIVFTVKMFIGFMIGIISIFSSFYFVAVAPKIDDNSLNIKENTKRFESINQSLIDINSGIGIINGNIQGINNRFRDLNQIRNDHQDSGGSLGD